MAEAGYPDGAGFRQSATPSTTTAPTAAIAEYVQNVWKEVLGVDCTHRLPGVCSVPGYRSAGDYALARAGWTVDYMDPSLMELWITSSGNNDCHFYNEEYDSPSAQPHTLPPQNTLRTSTRLRRFQEAAAVIPIYYYSEPYLMDTSKYDSSSLTWRCRCLSMWFRNNFI